MRRVLKDPFAKSCDRHRAVYFGARALRFPLGSVSRPARRLGSGGKSTYIGRRFGRGRHDGKDTVRAQPHGLSAYRRRPHGAVQLAVRAPARRAVPAADRRHRPAAQRRRGAPADPRRLPLARPRLGRRARGRRPVRAVLPVAAAAAAIERPSQRLLERGHAYRDYATTEEIQAERTAAEKEKRAFLYSRRWMAETDADARRFEAEGPQGRRAAQDAARRPVPLPRPRPRRRRVRLGQRAGPRRAARRRHAASITWRASSTITTSRSRT